MRIVFMGASDMGYSCCEALLKAGQQVVGILSMPREFRISWSASPVVNVRYRGFESLASEYEIPLVQMTTRMSDRQYAEFVKACKADLLLVIGWYYLVPRALRDLAPLGAVGIHSSLLPLNRGGAPLVWAMI